MAITRATNLAGLGTVFDALTDGGGLSISGISTFTDLNVTRANVTGVSTFATLNITNTNPTQLNVTGVTTTTTLVSTAASITTGGLVAGIATVNNINTTQLNVTGVTTTTSLVSTAASITSGGLVAGIATVNNINSTHLNIAGLGTFTTGPVLIGSGTSTGTASQSLQVTGGAYVSGNLGIGTTNPDTKLDVSGAFFLRPTSETFPNKNGVGLRLRSDTNHFTISALQWTPSIVYYDIDYLGLKHYWHVNGSQKMELDSGGNLLLGVGTSPYAGNNHQFSSSNGNTTLLAVQTNSSALTIPFVVYHTASTGNNNLIKFFTDSAPTERGSISYNRAGGLTAYNTTSDYRAKTISGILTSPGQIIDSMKVYEGTMNGATVSRPMFIAHELQQIAPYSVTGEKDHENIVGMCTDSQGNVTRTNVPESIKTDDETWTETGRTPVYQQVDHQSLVPLLVAEIQSLRARLSVLEQS